jgi:hypothetical protein
VSLKNWQFFLRKDQLYLTCNTEHSLQYIVNSDNFILLFNLDIFSKNFIDDLNILPKDDHRMSLSNILLADWTIRYIANGKVWQWYGIRVLYFE